MMWDRVMAYVKDLIEADPALVPDFGTSFRKAGTSEFKVPSIEWHLLSDTENELWAPMLVQFDIWHSSAATVRRAELRFRALFHHGPSVEFDGYTVMSEYADGNDLATPTRSGFTGRGLRFRFEPLRQRYAAPGV